MVLFKRSFPGDISKEAPKRTLQQGLEGIMRLPQSFEGLSDRTADTVRAVTEATDETKADITGVLGR